MPSSDEELAKKLQEQYRLEFLRRQAQSRATAPPDTTDSAAAVVRGRPIVAGSAADRRARQGNDDQALANRVAEAPVPTSRRRLQEWQDEQLARRISTVPTNPTANNPTAPTPPRPNLSDDANLARRLSDMENLRIGSSARVAPAQEESDAALARRLAMEDNSPPPPTQPTGPLYNSAIEINNNDNGGRGMDDDERLAQELQDAEVARRFAMAEQQGRQSQFLDERGSSFMAGIDEDPETTRARRIAQELEDEEMARRVNTYEEEAANRRRLEAMNRQQARTNKFNRAIGPMVCILALGTFALLWVFGVFSSESIPDFGDFDFDDVIDNDPFDGDVDEANPETAFAWKNSGNGLELEVLNALDANWQETFKVAMDNWENGTPDALSLTIAPVSYDFDCTAVNGKLKVCNGNYGNTRWRGLNEVLLNRRETTIFASSAKMNEYYLFRASDGQRLYTMCHEIGHGFGLPHWDENFFNADLGNCMDYTNNPEDNKTPDESNFQFLAALYGEVRRRISSSQRRPPNSFESSKIPDHIMDAYHQARKDLEGITSGRSDGDSGNGTWRMLHSNEYGHAHEADLGDDYVLQVHLLRG